MDTNDNKNKKENLEKIDSQNEDIKEKLELNDENLGQEKVQIKINLVGFIFIVMAIIWLALVGVVGMSNKFDANYNYVNNYDNTVYNVKSTYNKGYNDKGYNDKGYNDRTTYYYNDICDNSSANVEDNDPLDDDSLSKYDFTDFEAKPIIYIYSEHETEVSVRVGRPELLTTTYPKYNEEEGWQVIAKPDGTLVDCKTGRELYALYWEGINSKKYSEDLEEGFVVSGEDTAKFLEEKLEILGLNAREAEEFIVYWLPQMEHNNYNYIRFQTQKEINENMPLEIEPCPETLIRVMMEWKGLDKEIEVKQQNLEKVERKGYTVVEWGGTKIDSSIIN